jgi:hypothetical protein
LRSVSSWALCRARSEPRSTRLGLAGQGSESIRTGRATTTSCRMGCFFRYTEAGWSAGRLLSGSTSCEPRYSGTRLLYSPPVTSRLVCVRLLSLGPTRLVAIGAGLEAGWRGRHILLAATAGPTGNWLTSRPPGTREFSMGFPAAVDGGYEIRPGLFLTTGLEYHRLFANGESPRWILPVVVGVEVRRLNGEKA